jgi:hypothetical protein
VPDDDPNHLGALNATLIVAAALIVSSGKAMGLHRREKDF